MNASESSLPRPEKLGKAVRKYLAGHAEPECRLAHHFTRSAESFGHVVVIPSYGEGAGIWDAVASIPHDAEAAVLTIIVINARDDSPEPVRRANEESLRILGAELGAPEASLAGGAVLHRHGARTVLVVDRSTRTSPLPAKQGVGLARKIGADIALACRALGVLRSRWIHCTDADVRLPRDYFEQTISADTMPGAADVSAFTYPFHHRLEGSPQQRRAISDYETHLRYYVRGLRFANSPYAFHTIGSTLAIRTDAYAQVRGFPRRNAAEDFYLLNKLAKVGSVRALSGDAIALSGRVSDRVPFGTGRAIERALRSAGADSERTTYDPRLFVYLRGWIHALDSLAANGPSENFIDRLERSTRAIGEESEWDAGNLVSALHKTDSFRIAEHAARRSPAKSLRRSLHEAFDGYRTLKLLHALRDGGIPDVPLTDALQRAPFCDASDAYTETGNAPSLGCQ